MPRKNSLEAKLTDEIFALTARAKKNISAFDNKLFDTFSDSNNEELFFYTSILTFYAHIEGCIKNISIKYIDYLYKKDQNVQILPHLHFIVKNKNNATWIKWMKRVSILKKIDKNNSGTLIDTLNNLNFEILEQILFINNISEKDYVKYKTDLNNLVQLRNDIAHGNISIYYKKHAITKTDITKFKKMTLDLIQKFSNYIINTLDSIKI